MLDIVVSAAAGGAVAAIGVQLARDWEHRRRLAAVEARMDSLENARYGAAGRVARDDQKEELTAAMVEAANILRDESITDKGKALMGLGAKYPRVAAKLLEKGVKL